MKKYIYALLMATITSCSTPKEMINIEITNNVLTHNYLGNGAEWDPYCEAEVWGAPMTDREWDIIFKRVDFMKMSLVRCMINSPLRYYDAKNDCYERDRNIQSLKKMLDYCQKSDIMVMFGEFNSPKPEMCNDPRWATWAVDYLNYLVVDCGYTCIKYYIPCNEPDGSWAVTKGDYNVWKKMMEMFKAEIAKYPKLEQHITFASPDAVVDYKNPDFELGTVEWIKSSSSDFGQKVGLYDVHAYPGRAQVRNGEFAAELQEVLDAVPHDKRIVLGEAGYKSWRVADSVLNISHTKRLDEHKMIEDKTTDCNMLVYEYSYGLDMPILAMEVMNNGFAGMAAWMLDDTHTSADSGDTKNVKIWGMWNILASRVWNMPEEEQIRPWYYSWSLMCRYFRQGTDIMKIALPDNIDIKCVAGINNDRLSFAIVNYSDSVQTIKVGLPIAIENGTKYVYSQTSMPKDENGIPIATENGINAKESIIVEMAPQSFMLITGQDY